MVTLADRAPVVLGEKVTLTEQDPFFLSGVVHPLLCEKSPMLVPVMVTEPTCIELWPVLVSVIIVGLLLLPTRTAPKLICVGDSFRNVPAPESVTSCGLPGALSLRARVPFTAPAVVGPKNTAIVQLLPGARFPGQSGVLLKGLVTVVPVSVRLLVPVFVNVTFCCALLVPAN